MTNLILSKEPIQTPLTEWIHLYADQLSHDATFTILTDSRGYEALVCPTDLDNTLFFFLVNYLAHACTATNRKEVKGFTVGADAPEIAGKALVVYIPNEEKEFDNVTVALSVGEAYTIDFNGKTTQVWRNISFVSPPDLRHFSALKTLRVEDFCTAHTHEAPPNTPSTTRKVVICLLGALAVLAFGVAIQTQYRMLLPILLGTYLTVDYKRLQTRKSYLRLLGLTAFCTILFTAAMLHYQDASMGFALVMPLSLLMIQPPLRWLFISIMNREPVVEKPAPSMLDFVYTIALVGGSMGIAMAVSKLITLP